MSNLHDSTGCLSSYLGNYLNFGETEQIDEIKEYMDKVQADLEKLRLFYPKSNSKPKRLSVRNSFAAFFGRL